MRIFGERISSGQCFMGAQLDDTYMEEAYLDGAILREAQMHRTKLARALLRGADLRGPHIEQANLTATHLEGVTLWTVDAQARPQPPKDLTTSGKSIGNVMTTTEMFRRKILSVSGDAWIISQGVCPPPTFDTLSWILEPS